MWPHSTQVCFPIFLLITTTWIITTLEGKLISTAHEGPDVEGQTITRVKMGPPKRCGDTLYSCGRKAHCVNNKCVCRLGHRGDPRLECVPSYMLLSSVNGDPHIDSFDGSSAHIKCACRTLLTEVVTHHRMGRQGGRCHVKIFTLVHHTDDGYYVWGVDMQLTITDYSKVKAKGEAAVRLYGYQDGHDACYKEQGHQHGDHKGSKHWNTPVSLNYMDEIIETTYDHENNYVYFNVAECGIYTTFRAHVHGSHQFSGFNVCIDPSHGPLFPDSNKPLSGTPYSFGPPKLIREKHLHHLTKDEMVLYQTLSQEVDQDFGTSGLGCMLATKMFNRLCIDDASKSFAIHICKEFFFNETIMNCLRSNEFGTSSSSMFCLCTQAVCLKHKNLCDYLKEENKYLKCDLADAFDKLDCDNIGSAMKAFIPEAFRSEPETPKSIHEHGFHSLVKP